MDFKLEGKRALVTGSTAGIGFATARALAREGAHVTLNGRSESRIGQALEQLKAELAGAAADGIAADLSGVDGCRKLEFFGTARPISLQQRFATTDEVAAMIVYVCSTQASATTGAALRVDGGVARAIV